MEDTFSGRTQGGLYRTACPFPAHPDTFPIPSSFTFLLERGLRLNDQLGFGFLKLLLPPEGLGSLAKMLFLLKRCHLPIQPASDLAGRGIWEQGWLDPRGEVLGRELVKKPGKSI